MKNKMYLIHEDDYIKHINEKLLLCSLVKQLTVHISRLAPNRGSKALTDVAKRYGDMTDNLFQSWGIPIKYLLLKTRTTLLL